MISKLMAATAVVAGVMAVAGTAGADPRPNVETYLCDGVETDIVIAGRNGWIDGERWQAVEFTVTGTVTTPDGESFPVVDGKQWGRGATGAAEEVTCTQAINESDPEEGTFVGQVTVIIRPG